MNVFGNQTRVILAPTAVVNADTFFNTEGGTITLEDYAFAGHGVMFTTGHHDYKLQDRARQNAIPKSGRDILVKRGAWVASGCVIIGPCIIGEHSVVGAGTVLVHKNVPPNTLCYPKQELIMKPILFTKP